MQLKIQRSQRAGGMTGGTVFFCLDVRADYSAEEKANINRYKLGAQVIYSSQAARRHEERANAHLGRVDQSDRLADKFGGLARGVLSTAMARLSLNISIASLGRGHHVECKDLDEMLEAEDTIRNSCKNVTRYLQVADTFDGSEVVIEYVNGEEQVHITPHAPPLLEYSPSTPGGTALTTTTASDSPPLADIGERLKEFWANPGYRKLVYWGVGLLGLALLLRSCFS